MEGIMEAIRPIVFVGGTSERSGLVKALTVELQKTAIVHPWWSTDSFKPMKSTLDGLLAATQKYDFAVFFLTPDDFTISRKAKSFSSRDNVLFEFGLFLGALGPDRVLAFAQDDPTKRLKVPSDLLGVTIPRFAADSKDTIIASMVVLSVLIEKAIQAKGSRTFDLVIGWEIVAERKAFKVTLGPKRMQAHREKIQDREVLLVCRKHNPLLAAFDDKDIVIGTPRKVDPDEREVVLSVDLTALPAPLVKGDVIDGFLFLLPKNHRISGCKSIREISEVGCLLLDRGFGMPFAEEG
jgi:Predicted nucleotide-binding protein containing TIR-like domain